MEQNQEYKSAFSETERNATLNFQVDAVYITENQANAASKWQNDQYFPSNHCSSSNIEQDRSDCFAETAPS